MRFGSFKKPFVTISSLFKHYFSDRRFALFSTNKTHDYCRLWLKQKYIGTMVMNETFPDIYDEGYMQQFQPGPSHNIQKEQQKSRVLIYPPMEPPSRE